MACCGGKTGNPEEIKANEEINKQLREDKRRLDNEIKLLLLGAGESGKSTIAKQMKIIHKNGYSEEERASYKSIIYNNVISAMRTLINEAANLGLTVAMKDAADRVLSGGEENFASLAGDIKALWNDAGVKGSFAQASKFQLIDSAQYYFENVERLAEASYMPNEQDVLRSRAKTTGIIEMEFDVEGVHFRMVDVGGQRSERKKWIHCFQDVTCVIFCVALSEYDLKLQEDESTNRMHESLKLFKEICNSKWFLNTSMILFLNKKDLFAEKIEKVDLNVCFGDYTGGKNFDNATKYIEKKFRDQNENKTKAVFVHVTCATDTNNITHVFSAVKDTILRNMLRDGGVM